MLQHIQQLKKEMSGIPLIVSSLQGQLQQAAIHN